jgi:hypothetical protein
VCCCLCMPCTRAAALSASIRLRLPHAPACMRALSRACCVPRTGADEPEFGMTASATVIARLGSKLSEACWPDAADEPDDKRAWLNDVSHGLQGQRCTRLTAWQLPASRLQRPRPGHARCSSMHRRAMNATTAHTAVFLHNLTCAHRQRRAVGTSAAQATQCLCAAASARP